MLQTPLRFLVPKQQESSSSSASNLPLVLHPLCFLGRCLAFSFSFFVFSLSFSLVGVFEMRIPSQKVFKSQPPLFFTAEKIALKKSRHKDDTSTRKCPITTRWAVARQLYFFSPISRFMSGWEKKGGAYFYIFKSDLFLPSWHYEKTLKRNNNWNIIIYIIAYKIKLRGRTWTIIG